MLSGTDPELIVSNDNDHNGRITLGLLKWSFERPS